MADHGAPLHHCNCVWVFVIILSLTQLFLNWTHIPEIFAHVVTSNTAQSKEILYVHYERPMPCSPYCFVQTNLAIFKCNSQHLQPICQILFLSSFQLLQRNMIAFLISEIRNAYLWLRSTAYAISVLMVFYNYYETKQIHTFCVEPDGYTFINEQH